jgi:nucleoside-diphosphate-sugar epimerase
MVGEQLLLVIHLENGQVFNDVNSDGILNNEPLLAELIDRSDVVFHFAAAVGVKLIVEQPSRLCGLELACI